MSFQVNGTTGTPVDAMRITSAGNVGIGTVSPSAKLHINTGATENAVFTKYETTGNGYGGIEFRGTRGSGTNGSTIGQISSYWQNNARGNIIFNDGGDISILPTRNAGIGTASPSAPLHVIATGDTKTNPASPATNGLYVYNPTNSANQNACLAVRVAGSAAGDPFVSFDIANEAGWCLGIDNSDANKFKICSNWRNPRLDNRLVIDTTGNVGIGTASPDSLGKLHVNGNVYVGDGNYLMSGYNSTGVNQYFGKEYGGRILAGMEIENTTLGGNYSQKLHLYTHRFGVSEGRRFTVDESGYVGIGTTTPYAPLTVYGSGGNINYGGRGFFYYGGGVAFDGGTWSGVTIYGGGNIVSQLYFVSHFGTLSASDIRIKKNIVDADDAECLETLRLLKPKKYQYKDEIGRGREPVWGFIAQEVRDTLPYATGLRTDVLPNIYELANVSQSNVITFVNFNTSNLESNATTLIRTKGIDGEDHDIHLVEVIDEHTVRVEEDLSAWTGSVDAEGNVITQIETTTLTPEEYEALEDKTGCVANISGYQNANVVISVEEYNGLEDTTGYEEVIDNYTKTTTIYPGTQLFVYGQEVDDFIFVKKDAIWTVATAALQEVDRQLQAEKAKTATLETQLVSVLARLDALEGT